jgi:leader peptidase (prepilin peptidase)/N-methyltransferase
VVVVWVALSVRPAAATIVYGAALTTMIVAATVDTIKQRLPNVLTLGVATLGLAALPAISWMAGDGSAWRPIAGGAIFGGWILVGALALRGAYGLGDVKLAAACGIYAAWLSWTTLAVAILVSQVAITVTLICGRLRGRERVPLGPAFVLGLIASILFGADI